MAEQYPVILVVEDVQWADAALIEFLEYLLEWSRAFHLRTHARSPSLASSRPRSSSVRTVSTA